MRGEPSKSRRTSSSSTFQLTRPVRGEPGRRGDELAPHIISTHSPRAGRTTPRISPREFIKISTHSPRAGRTLPVNIRTLPRKNFNSLAPCGANRLRGMRIIAFAPFQLTRPVRGEPGCIIMRSGITRISTHSPRAGRTKPLFALFKELVHFNSLAPCGANQSSMTTSPRRSLFQLTRPVRGEPDLLNYALQVGRISTHSPRAGRTLSTWRTRARTTTFQLTRPVRGEPERRKILFLISFHFNSLAPCGANLLLR